MNYTLNLLTF